MAWEERRIHYLSRRCRCYPKDQAKTTLPAFQLAPAVRIHRVVVRAAPEIVVMIDKCLVRSWTPESSMPDPFYASKKLWPLSSSKAFINRKLPSMKVVSAPMHVTANKKPALTIGDKGRTPAHMLQSIRKQKPLASSHVWVAIQCSFGQLTHEWKPKVLMNLPRTT